MRYTTLYTKFHFRATTTGTIGHTARARAMYVFHGPGESNQQYALPMMANTHVKNSAVQSSHFCSSPSVTWWNKFMH